MTHTGNVLYETSPPDARYTGAIIRPPDKDNFQLTFHVRTCADAHIMLVPLIAPDITNYEVIFGSSANTLSEIRKSGKMVDRVPTPYMMTANMYACTYIHFLRSLFLYTSILYCLLSEWVGGGLTRCRQLGPSSRREHVNASSNIDSCPVREET